MDIRFYYIFRIFCIGILCLPKDLEAQNFISVSIDSIHCHNARCFLLNIEDDKIFTCDFIALEQCENRYKYSTECTFEEDSIFKHNELNNFKKIRTLDGFLNWQKNINFKSKFEYNNVLFSDVFQYFANGFAIQTRKKLNKTTNLWQNDQQEAFYIIPIKVNDDFFIGGLIPINYYDIEYILFPTLDNKGVLYNKDKLFEPGSTFETIDSSKYRVLFSKYKVRKFKSKYILTNSISNVPLLKDTCESIVLEYPYIITRSGNRFKIYDQFLKDITPLRLNAAYANFGPVQLIVDNKMKWLNVHGEIVDVMPKIIKYVCGNNPCSEKAIKLVGENFVELSNDCYDYNFKKATDTLTIIGNSKYIEIKYLTNTTAHTFVDNCFMDLFCHDINLYYFKTKENKEGVLSKINEKKEQMDIVRNDKSLSHNQKYEKLQHINRSSLTTYREEIQFEGEFEEFRLMGYNHPIIFKKDNLYGIFPQMRSGKYKEMQPFVGNLSEVVFKNGKKGWVDLQGNELRNRH